MSLHETRWMLNPNGLEVHPVREACEGLGCRPVVVLDPEDEGDRLAFRDAARRFPVLFMDSGQLHDEVGARLRSLIPPPPPTKPDEPQGLGAVVRDSDDAWVRVDTEDVIRWRQPDIAAFRDWDDFSDAVEVLSDGWTGGES